jgi:hypothetical protein
MGTTMPKLICEKTVNGVTAVRNITTPAVGNQGSYVKTIVGVGNPFWFFPSIPAGILIGADFTNAPICSDDVAANNAAIASISVEPADVLVYQA